MISKEKKTENVNHNMYFKSLYMQGTIKDGNIIINFYLLSFQIISQTLLEDFCC